MTNASRFAVFFCASAGSRSAYDSDSSALIRAVRQRSEGEGTGGVRGEEERIRGRRKREGGGVSEKGPEQAKRPGQGQVEGQSHQREVSEASEVRWI